MVGLFLLPNVAFQPRRRGARAAVGCKRLLGVSVLVMYMVLYILS